jgi:hypothetical protein
MFEQKGRHCDGVAALITERNQMGAIALHFRYATLSSYFRKSTDTTKLLLIAMLPNVSTANQNNSPTNIIVIKPV